MVIKKTYNIIILILVAGIIYPQKRVPIKLWGLQSFNGIVGIEGEYRTQDIKIKSGYSDLLKTSILVGQIALNTSSYFYHPNLILLETEMEYFPGTRKDLYLVIPDRAESNIGEKVGGLLTFFRTLPITINVGGNYSHIYTSRELTTDVETYNTSFSAGLRYRNSIAPINVTYQNSYINQLELLTERRLLTKRQSFVVYSDFSLGKLDKNKLSYSYDKYNREYYSFTNISNKIITYKLNSSIYLKSNRTNFLNSNIYYSINKGNFDYGRLNVNEILNLELRKNFKFISGYRFFQFDQDEFRIKQHSIDGRFEHQLYKSLKTYIYYEYVNSNQYFTNEITNTGGIGLYYTKQIPTGRFSLSYEFRKRSFNKDNATPPIKIFNEQHILSDDVVVLLEKPYIRKNSIVVKDETGTIIYRENFDYAVFERNNFIEIQRIPGGLIQNGDVINVDYIADAQPAYEYNVDIQSFMTRLDVFNNFLEIYYRFSNNNYNNIIGRNPAVLKSFLQKIYGAKIHYKYFSMGIEYDDYNSNIVPYKSMKYYLAISTRLGNKFNFSLSGNQKYFNLIEDNQKQEFSDLSGRFLYSINEKTSVSMDLNYRFQKGKGLDLNLSVVRIELSSQYREIYLNIGLEGYNRNYISEKLKYLGTYVRISRKF